MHRKYSFGNFMISLPNKTKTPHWHSYTVGGHKLRYCDLNSFLVITRLIHAERLSVWNHEITKIMQIVVKIGMKYRNCVANM